MKKVSKIKIELQFLPFIIYAFLGVLINTSLSNINFARQIINIIRILCVFFLILDFFRIRKENFFKINSINFCAYLIFFIFASLIFLFSNSQQLLLLSFFLLFASNYDLKKILKYHKNTVLFTLLFVFLFSFIGVFENYIVYRNNSNIPRFTFGFIAPTLLPAYFMFVVLEESYINDFKISKRKLFIYGLISIFLYVFTGTRFDFMLTLLVLILNILLPPLNMLKCNKRLVKRKKTFKCFYFIPLIAVIINVSMIYLFVKGNPLMIKIADLLSNRIQYTIKALSLVKPTVFGVNVNWQDFNVILDSSYFKYLLEYGVLGFIILIVLYYLLIFKGVQNKDFFILIIISLLALESIFEPFALDYNYQLFILYATTQIKKIRGENNAETFSIYRSCYPQQENAS